MKRRGLWLSLAAVALALLAGRAFAGVYSEYRWYAALGALDVWALRFGQAATLRVVAFAVATLAAFANVWAVRHSVISLVMPRRVGDIEIGEQVPGRVLMLVVVSLAVLLGALFAIPAVDWQSFALARMGVAFDETDPYFNADLGFFVYWLPFERAAYAWFTAVTTIIAVMVVALYALTPSLRWEAGRLHVSAYVRRHVAVLGGAALALLAWSFRLDAYGALLHGSGQAGAFTAVDDQLGIPISILLSYATIAAAFVVAWAGWTGQTRVALTVVTAVLLLTPTMRYALPVAVRWASTPVDPAVRERPYESVRALATRRAFGVDRIETFDSTIAIDGLLDAASISVWDPAAVALAMERMRRRGAIIGAPAITMTSAGPAYLGVEQPAQPVDASGGGWTLVRALASVTDERGGLVRVDANGRYPMDDQSLRRVLFHAGARGHLVVTDTASVIAAPGLGSFGARLTEAWSIQDFRLLAAPADGSRILRRRDVRERVAALAPFFAVGSTVFPLAHGDSLLWVVELFATSDAYPLARRLPVEDGDISYMRHAATALVNAHSGRVTMIPVADPDPVAETWMRRASSTFAPRHSLPPTLLAALPPAVDGVELQAEAFGAVGFRSDGGLRRHVPSLDGSDTLVASNAPTLLWSPGTGTPAWSIPFIDSRDRVAGALVATGGTERTLTWFPSDDTLRTWGGLLEQLQMAASGRGRRDAAPRASGRVRLWPSEDGDLIAAQPFYSWPADGPPSLLGVAVASRDSTIFATSIAAAVGAPVPFGPEPATPGAERARMRELYAEMEAALSRGDLRAFGEAFEAMGRLLGRR